MPVVGEAQAEEGKVSSFSLRMDDHEYDALRAMSLLTGTPMSELVRVAIGETVTRFGETARRDGALDEQLRQRQQAVALLEQRAASLAERSTDVQSGTGSITTES